MNLRKDHYRNSIHLDISHGPRIKVRGFFKLPAAGRDVSGARRLATRYRPAAARSMVPAVFPLWEGLTAGAHPEGADPTDGIFYLAVAGYPSDLLCPTMQSGELPVSSRRLSAMVQSVRPQLIIAIRGPAPWRRFSSSHPAGPPRNSASFCFFLHNCFAFANYYKKESRTSDPLPGRL